MRNIQTVSTTLSPYISGGSPARPESPAAPKPIRIERPQSPVSAPPKEQPENAPAPQATTRRLRNQLKGARTINIILLVVCGLFAAGLITAMVLPSESPEASSEQVQPSAAPARAPVASAPLATDASSASAIESARSLVQAGDPESLEDAIASLESARASVIESGGSTEAIDEELESLNAKLDAIRLRDALK